MAAQVDDAARFHQSRPLLSGGAKAYQFHHHLIIVRGGRHQPIRDGACEKMPRNETICKPKSLCRQKVTLQNQPIGLDNEFY
jgi:hypothetical protein